jgi:hypothetical protein
MRITSACDSGGWNSSGGVARLSCLVGWVNSQRRAVVDVQDQR